jgi:hypothetical protein
MRAKSSSKSIGFRIKSFAPEFNPSVAFGALLNKRMIRPLAPQSWGEPEFKVPQHWGI